MPQVPEYKVIHLEPPISNLTEEVENFSPQARLQQVIDDIDNLFTQKDPEEISHQEYKLFQRRVQKLMDAEGPEMSNLRINAILKLATMQYFLKKC